MQRAFFFGSELRQERFRAEQARAKSLLQRQNWRVLILPTIGALTVATLLGPLIFGLVFAGLAFGATMTAGVVALATVSAILPLFAVLFAFSTVFFGFVPLMLSGLFIGSAMFQLAMVGGSLALGYRVAQGLMSQRRAAAPSARPAQAHIDVEVESSEARQAREDAEQAAAAADELARFDAELAERARERQVNQGTRWTL